MVGLSISVKQSKILSVYLSPPVKITVGSEAMEQVTYFRYLGTEITVSVVVTLPMVKTRHLYLDEMSCLYCCCPLHSSLWL